PTIRRLGMVRARLTMPPGQDREFEQSGRSSAQDRERRPELKSTTTKLKRAQPVARLYKLYGQCVSSFFDQMAVRVEGAQRAVYAVGLVGVPVTVHGNATDVQHSLGARRGPVPTGPLHAVLHQVPAGPFDHTAGDRLTGRQVHV